MKFFKFNRAGEITTVSNRPIESVVIKAVTKRELAKMVASRTGCTKTDVDKIIGECLATIAESLKSDRPVVISGFGKFRPRKPKKGNSRNPMTGKVVRPTDRKSVAFKPSVGLKKKLND